MQNNFSRLFKGSWLRRGVKMTSDSAKKGWKTRRVNARYKEILKQIELDKPLQNVILENQEILIDLRVSTNQLLRYKQDYNEIMDRIDAAGNVIENLTISSLKDSIEYENSGRPSKGIFKDLLQAEKIKKAGMAIADEKTNLLSESKIAQINILQANIEALLRATE